MVYLVKFFYINDFLFLCEKKINGAYYIPLSNVYKNYLQISNC
jgi:uncharacterized protein (DUF427 family)